MDDERNRKIHRYLDDELQRHEVTADELRDIAVYEDMINETRRLYRSVEAPDLSAAIMKRLEADAHKKSVAEPLQDHNVDVPPRALLWRIAGWMWSVHSVRLRPIYGIAASAAIVMVVLLIGGVPFFKDTTKPDEAIAARSMVFVQFRLEAPHASMVRLAGSFSNWQPAYALHESAPGVWSVLVPLEPGVHDYVFLVNDRWIIDPVVPAVDDGFGGAKNRLLILTPNGGSTI